MPIDPSIPLQVQPLKLESPINQLAMMESVNKMQEMGRQREVRNMLSSVDPNSPDAMKQIWAYDPPMAMEFASKQAALKTAALTQEKTQSDIFTNNVKQAKDALPGVTDQKSYDAWRENFKDKMPSGYTLPDQYSHQVKTGLMYDAKSYIDANTVSANTKATLAQGMQIHKDVQNRPQYIQTDAGLVAVPNVLKPGQAPVGVPVMGANGENLGRPLKEIPPTVNKAIIENDISLNKANRALALLQGKDVTTPKGDVIKGSADATGFWKGLTPQVILNNWDPGGVSTRAFVADIGSLKVHDRSGAAVTASETPRLKPFIPSIYDSPENAATKLINFKAEYEDIQRGLTETYSREQGYRPSPVLSGKSSGGGNKPSLDSIFNPKQ